MELHQLRYIVALSQERNFLRAAMRVNITQPTLSHQIKKLEDEIGCLLFERSTHGVRLTVAGEKFIPYAISTLDNLSKGVAQVQEESKEILGSISVGVIPTIGPYLIPDALIKIRKEAPRLSLKLYEETTSLILNSLKIGKIDLGILALPITNPGIVSQSLGTEDFLLAVSKRHPLSKRKQVTPKLIQKENLLILQEGHCFSDQALEYCDRLRDDSKIVFQGSSLTSVMKLAAADGGLTLVPKMAANAKENPSLTFIPFALPRPQREIGIVWRLTAPLTPTHHYFIDLLKKTFSAL